MEGRVYQDVVFTKISAGGVSFKHSDGAGRLRFDELSPAQRKYFGLEEEAAVEVYQKEAERRAAYERLVEKRAEERRIMVEKEAVKREEARQVAMELAATEAAKAPAEPAAKIPLYPTIKRVDTRRVYRSRSYGGYTPFYRQSYGYSPYSNYRPGYRQSYGGSVRFRNFSCSTPSIIIRR